MVGRTGRGAEGTHLIHQVIFQLARTQQGFGFLIEIGFIGGTATFGDTEELVLIAIHAVEVDLRWQVSAGIHLFIHIQGGILRIAQVIFDIGVVDTL